MSNTPKGVVNKQGRGVLHMQVKNCVILTSIKETKVTQISLLYNVPHWDEAHLIPTWLWLEKVESIKEGSQVTPEHSA